VHPATPFQSVNDVINFSKKESEKWSYGTSGVGGPHHLSGEYFKSVTGANLAARALQGRRAGDDRSHGRPDPDALLLARPGAGAVKSGKIRALAVTSPRAPRPFRKCRRWTKPG